VPVLLLAFLSGIPALVYEVVWTREVALLAGSQIEAISVVLVAFFGGLALGARLLGARADRSAAPLRLYGALEIGAGALAAASLPVLRMLGETGVAAGPVLLALAAALLLPVTFLLGGTLPALLREAAREVATASRHAGGIVGANTAGSVLGVALATAMIPAAGLRATQGLAGVGGIAVGVAALILARRGSAPGPVVRGSGERRSRFILAAAFAAGIATLAYEILVARMATLRLGSSLYAWAAVLSLFLLGLAAGNLALARRSARSADPELELGWIEVGAAVALAGGLLLIAQPVASPAGGPTAPALLAVAVGVLPAAFLMGGAFPFLVRLTGGGPELGAALGAVTAANTAGGIAGALLAPFALLPLLGPVEGALACAALNAALGVAFLARGSRDPAGVALRVSGAIACVAVPAAFSFRSPSVSEGPRVLYVDHGRQATAVVAQIAGRRDLVVDGDPEASTGGQARRTEELLAVLPLLLHPRAERFLEVGLGSGITLGTATRFPLERVDCVEIAESVIRSARYFAPDNRHVFQHESARIIHMDARVFLARHPGSYDVVAANTLHPWSVGATGLYSREYFGRIARALRAGGLGVQWLPLQRMGPEALTLILRTFFEAFPHGGLWWGAGNLLLVGSDTAVRLPDAERIRTGLGMAGLTLERLGISDPSELAARRIATAQSVREVLGAGELLTDDRPLLEVRAIRGRTGGSTGNVYSPLVRIARGGVAKEPRGAAVLLWLESLEARAAGDQGRADRREALAEAAGFSPARRAAAVRRVLQGYRELDEGRLDEAAAALRAALELDAEQRDARIALAGIAIQRGALEEGRRGLERLVEERPEDAAAQNELGAVLHRIGDRKGGRQAIEAALRANPYYPEALANAGLMAAESGDMDETRRMLERLRAISPLGSSPEEQALLEALSAER